jgi:transcriptional regulator with XRE-family HTH domain
MNERILIPCRNYHPAKDALEKARLNAADLARYLGIAYQQAWSILAGDRKPTEDQAERIAKLIDACHKGLVSREPIKRRNISLTSRPA